MSKDARVVVLHLSDLHFGWDGSQIERDERKLSLDSLSYLLASINPPWRPNCVCISGDIGWKGKAGDYEEATRWVKELMNALKMPVEALFICPGNHDIDRDIAKGNTRPRSSEEADLKLAVPIQQQIQTPFEAFINFCMNLGVPPYLIGESESYLVGCRPYKGVNFISLNTVWFSKDDDDRGKLWIGQPQIKHMEASRQLPPPYQFDLWNPIIAFFHHPRECLSDPELQVYNKRPNTFDYLCQRCHLLLTGHTHGEVRNPDMFAGRAWHLSGGAAYAGASHFNSFRIIQVEKGRFCSQAYVFRPGAADHLWQIVDTKHTLPRKWQSRLGYQKTIKSKLSKIHVSSRYIVKPHRPEMGKVDGYQLALLSFMLFFPDGLLRSAYQYLISQMAAVETSIRAVRKKLIIIIDVNGAEMARLSPGQVMTFELSIQNKPSAATRLLSILNQWITKERPFENITAVGIGRAILIRDLLSMTEYLSREDSKQQKCVEDIYRLAHRLLPQIINERHSQTAYEISKRLFEFPEYSTPLSCLNHARLLIDMGEPKKAADIMDMFRGDDLFTGYMLDDITRIELGLDWAKAKKDAGYGRQWHSEISNVYKKMLGLLNDLKGTGKKDPQLYRLEATILHNRATQIAVFGRAMEWTRAKADYEAAGNIYNKLDDKVNLIAVHANLVSQTLDRLKPNAPKTKIQRLLNLLEPLKHYAVKGKPSEEVFFFYYQIGRLQKRIYKRDPKRPIEAYRLASLAAQDSGLSNRAPIAQRWILRLSKQASLIQESEYIHSLHECANALRNYDDSWAANTFCDISIELALNYNSMGQIGEAWDKFVEAFDSATRFFVRNESTMARARIRNILIHMDKLKIEENIRDMFLANNKEAIRLLLDVSIHQPIRWPYIRIWLRKKERF